jgi:hypothetical protein
MDKGDKLWAYPAYAREPHLEYRKERGSQSYKKGWEVRIVLTGQSELPAVHELILAAGFRVARPFAKRGRIIQPIYGKKAVEEFHAARASSIPRARGRGEKRAHPRPAL